MPRSARLETTDEARARTRSLAWGAAWRMVLWGVGLGALLGGLFAGLIFSPMGAFFSAGVIGALVGGPIGLLEGVISAVVIAVALVRNPWLPPLDYRSLAMRASLASVFVVYIVATIIVMVALGPGADLKIWLLSSVVPLLIDILTAWWASWRVAAWMVRRVIGEPVEPALPPRLASASHPQVHRVSRKKH